MQLWMSDCSFIPCYAFSNVHQKWCTYSAFRLLHGAMWNCCHLGTHYLCTPHTSLQCHFIQSHIGRVHVCLAVTWHLHFWQNDWDLVHATVVTQWLVSWCFEHSKVTQGWNGYRNRCQCRMLTLEKKILLPLLPGCEPLSVPSPPLCHWPMYLCSLFYHLIEECVTN